MITRINVLEAFVESNKIPDTRESQPDRNMAKILVDMKNYLKTLIQDPPMQKSTMDAIIDSKIKSAMAFGKSSTRDEDWPKSVFFMTELFREQYVCFGNMASLLNHTLSQPKTQNDFILHTCCIFGTRC